MLIILQSLIDAVKSQQNFIQYQIKQIASLVIKLCIFFYLGIVVQQILPNYVMKNHCLCIPKFYSFYFPINLCFKKYNQIIINITISKINNHAEYVYS
ncbi:hypothetical protein pb186bvf_017759 [Paramecium bursaria]